MYIPFLLILQEGEIHLVPNCPTHLFSKNHTGVTVYLLNSLLLGISSHGYVKDILWVFGYNNFYANIGLALFKARLSSYYFKGLFYLVTICPSKLDIVTLNTQITLRSANHECARFKDLFVFLKNLDL